MKFRSLEELKQLLSEDERKNSVVPPIREKHDGKGKTVHISLDSKGRKGKSVTLITGLQHNPQILEKISTLLKQYCGAGGTVKDGVIEIQGDQRKRVAEKLRAMNYVVK